MTIFSYGCFLDNSIIMFYSLLCFHQFGFIKKVEKEQLEQSYWT